MINKFKVQSSKFKVVLLFAFFLVSLLYPNPYTLTPTSADWILDAAPPTCTSLTLSKNSPQLVNTSITITPQITETGGSGLDTTYLNITGPVNSTQTSTSTSPSFSWTPNTAGTYKMSSYSIDKAGNIGTYGNACSKTFVIDNIPPSESPGVPVITIPIGCSNNTISSAEQAIEISWTNPNPPVNLVTIDRSPFSRPCATKSVIGTAGSSASTYAPVGFWDDCRSGGPGPLSLSPNLVYFVTLDNVVGTNRKAFSIPYCPAPAAPTVDAGGCVTGPYSGSDVTARGSNETDPVSRVDVGTDIGFTSFWSRAVTTTANQSYSVQLDVPIGGSSFQPGTTYYVRVYNGQPSAGASFIRDLCPPPVPPGTPIGNCPAGTTNVRLSWYDDPDAIDYRVRIGANPPITRIENFYEFTGTLGTTYDDWGVAACNAAGCSAYAAGNSFTCNYTPWIQTTGGDVHSNKGINAPGGP